MDNVWKGSLSPRLRKTTVHEPGEPMFEVTDVIDGFAIVVVHFDHHDIRNGRRITMPSNNIGYEYEIEVGGMDIAEVENDITLRATVDGKIDPASLVEVLETM